MLAIAYKTVIYLTWPLILIVHLTILMVLFYI